jgi:hypothetical protein
MRKVGFPSGSRQGSREALLLSYEVLGFAYSGQCYGRRGFGGEVKHETRITRKGKEQ